MLPPLTTVSVAPMNMGVPPPYIFESLLYLIMWRSWRGPMVHKEEGEREKSQS